jgi:hypothetical protein
MKAGWVVGLVTAYVLLMIFGFVCDLAWFDGETVSDLNTLGHPNIVDSGVPVVGVIVGALVAIKEWLGALFRVLFLKFDFFSGSYMLVWYIFCLPVCIGLIVAIVLSLIGRGRAA